MQDNRRRVPVYTQEEADARVRGALARERRRTKIIEPSIAAVDPQKAPGGRVSFVLANTPGIWEHFKPVPEAFYRREGTTAWIACPCGYLEDDDPELAEQRIEYGRLYECPGCARLYFNGKRLHAARADDPEEVSDGQAAA